MRIARPSILWRLLSVELWRLLAITSAVLVCVIAFATTIKPFADGRLGALDALRFMGYAIIPMLQYALPFAAGFAATLSYHRLAQDNELTAVYAGGISHRAMLLPALISGLLLSGVLLVLADQAMPRLLRSMDELITRDFTRMLQSSVERGQALVQPGGQRVLYADRFVPGQPEPGSNAVHKFDLLGVVVVQREPGSGLTWEASASRATVWVYRGGAGTSGGDVAGGASGSAGAGVPGAEDSGPGSMTVVMRLLDSVGKSTGRATGQAGESTMSFVVPSIFRDDPKFLTFTEMLLAQDDPRRLGDVMAQHRATASILNERSVADDLRVVLERDKRTTLTDLNGRTVVVKATGLDLAPVENAKGLAAGAFALRSSSGPIEVTTVLEDGRARVQRARRAWISVPPAPEFQASLLTIRMSEVSTSGVAPDGEGTEQAGGVIREYQIPNLRLPEDRLAPLLMLDSKALLAVADKERAAHPDDVELRRSVEIYQSTVRDTQRELLSKFHERIAASLACALMVLLGAVMGMRLSLSLPLTVYLWSFLPALGCVLLVSGGQRATASWGAPGLLVLYGGLVALGSLTFAQYRVLAMR